MREKQLEHVSFDFIRYANCWEDADVLLNGLAPGRDAQIMSIASAGDNSFSLLSAQPERVIAVDISKVQLLLVELKKAAIKTFDRDDYLKFAGFSECDSRVQLYNKLKNILSKDCYDYWNHHTEDIRTGIIHAGKFEKYFQLFKRDFLPKIHSQEVVDELMREKSADEQRTFHDTTWHTEEWKTMYRFFFGEQMMGSHGRDPEFLKHVTGSVSDIIHAQEVAHLRTKRAQKNYFLYYILNNRFDENYLPHYVRAGNYEKIKANIDRLVLHEGLLDQAMITYPNCTHFNLSDIFEYMDENLFKTVASSIIGQSAPRAKIAYWNLMIPRKISDLFPQQVNYQKELSEQLTAVDNGYFYRSFIVDQKR